MIINHNIAALNTHRQLSNNNNAVQSSLEKLSSGLKINKAGDDAAGLAISEKMRGQIRGLEMAQKNAQDGISLIQTAEGAMNETHAILQRMRELANQSSNDTNTDQDRAELQKEVDQLANALNDISEDTEFNTKKLLDGTLKDATFHVGANEGQNLKVSISNMSGTELKVAETYNVDDLTYQDATQDVDYTVGTNGDEITYGGKTATWQAADPDPAGDGSLPGTPAGYYEGGNLVLEADTKLTDGETGTIKGKAGGYYDGDKLVIEAEEDNLSGEVTVGINISSQESADKAISTIQTAIDNVSAERSKIGAVQNRLQHTINNLGTSAENLTAAESRIRDVDMAKEMMAFTKNNILTQAAQSMLAQANQQPQGVLQLLR
ncbi:flagellin [Virgibacillus pantothenticus]|uniref:flagellin N-terminal helical domain-containing protein n=1 Tax=Virgibacillus TaxID=84406 RepID=UPI000909D0D6|nr:MULTISPECIES: flagellin [Virgibacillus]API91449.1 flagellin [Virgibacillus sp. 6R]MBS7426704.1 flagellin [Virgibacillus sp. 19R1-5]MBU8568428.1 flagellin [Virgibacillus pantothenticus]MBU8602388.1 flagellin [Virgibacillus pantothenticus]MBU8636524.1 flagellin [Virgibacillus pantothenticus]